MIVALVMLVQATPDVAAALHKELDRQACRSEDPDEVLVCADRRRSPYRLPERKQFDPSGTTMSVMRERQSWAEEGDSGIGSCSAVGPGGWTGCMVKDWKRQRDQTAWGKNVPTKRW
ncbi:hypothetical protein [Sphingomonas mesophila]|uniref:hypothetical protein n=1 Tax=Sphingomonas mesophila TaxID=2303576 RepID=UPI0013C2BD04|nr:hypothetical protein [Sphingomonas mesophila]